jgi:type I restriction enzyme M protein
MQNLEADLWEAADQLRANSKLTANEYSQPVLGLIFLRHAYNRFLLVKDEIEPTLPLRGGVRAPLQASHFQGKAAIFLPEKSQYSYLVNLPEDQDIGKALVEAMELIEAQVPMLSGALPKEYTRFEPKLLRDLLRIFNRDALQNANGDVFGRIYEYFLNKFAMSGAQEGGEFLTPPSLVRLIVNVIEPDHGIVFDPACGSGGMFVWTGYFLNEQGTEPSKAVTIYGQEKAETNTRLSRMNLAVHGLEGQIVEGNTFYDRRLDLVGKCDYVMANPPFNVDGVDPARLKNDPRLPFGLPGLAQKTGAVSNANYLWIQYFYAYLNERGRAGFVMASSATDAGHSEKTLRQKLLQTGHVDVVIAIGTNFFYTLTLPCTLWFFDKRKPAERRDKVLMLDARSVYHVVTRKLRDFTDEQLANLTAIVWLYRGEGERFLKLVREYLEKAQAAANRLPECLAALDEPAANALKVLQSFAASLHANGELSAEDIRAFQTRMEEARTTWNNCQEICAALLMDWQEYRASTRTQPLESNTDQHTCRQHLAEFEPRFKDTQRLLNESYKQVQRAQEAAEKGLTARRSSGWDGPALRKALESWNAAREEAVEALRESLYFAHQAALLQERFPEAQYADVPGLCKVVTLEEIEAKDASLTPGRYVGYSFRTDDDIDFSERISVIHTEIESLSQEASDLITKILSNYKELEL